MILPMLSRCLAGARITGEVRIDQLIPHLRALLGRHIMSWLLICLSHRWAAELEIDDDDNDDDIWEAK